ncbi:MAG: RNA methyltransferase [Cyanobacteria bacterium P01_H01_bin.130]
MMAAKSDGLDGVRIVLVEPAGPRNVGSIARVMANFGLSELVLVNPQCDRHSPEARMMAVHAKDILETAQVVNSVPDALAGCQRVAATLGREFAGRVPVEAIAQVSPWLLGQDLPDRQDAQKSNIQKSNIQKSNIKGAILFGREDHGLSNDDLDYAQRLVTIPTGADYASLNLAQAVGVCAYELRQAALGISRSPMSPSVSAPSVPFAPSAPPAPSANGNEEDAPPFEQLERFYGDLEALLLDVGYLYPHTATPRMKTFRNLLHRATPTAREVAMLRGILRQMRWAIAHPDALGPSPDMPEQSTAGE